MMIRWIATILNVVLLAFLIVLIVKNGFASDLSARAIFFESLVITAPGELACNLDCRR